MATATEDRAVMLNPTLFKYSEWVHIGARATDEEYIAAVEDGTAERDPDTFHAWVRLPNQFQNRAIRDRALAAKARTRRMLRDEQTDAYMVLEEDLSQMAMADDAAEQLVGELLSQDWWEDFQKAQLEMKHHSLPVDPTDDDPEPEPERPYSGVDEDQRRLRELEALSEDERPTDEYDSLTRHLDQYAKDLQEKLTSLQEPRKTELESLGIDALVDRVRTQRIERFSMQEFMHFYNTWQWIAGTFDQPRGKQLFHDPKDFEELDESVIEAIRDAFTRLENARGNS